MASLTSEGNITSFQKKGRNRIPYIQGTRQSVQNAQILASSGVPSLDHVLGNGLPVGTILLIEEDVFGTFAKLMLKYFLAEGAACDHPLFLASRDIVPKSLMKDLPLPIKSDSGSGSSQGAKVEDPMTIAWRYQNMRQVQSAPGSSNSGTQLGHNFDLTQTISPEDLDSCDFTLWSGPEENDLPVGGFINPDYGFLLSRIQKHLLDGQFGVQDEPSKHSILRLAIHSLGSPLWVNSSCGQSLDATIKKDLPRFLLCLRSLLRESYALAMVTVPCHLFQDPAIQRLCEYQSDMALKFESFAGSSYETNPVFKEYHGLLHVRKLGPINTLATPVPESLDLAFKLRRRKFVIEKLHLPPELQESAQREQDDILSGNKSFSCSSNQSSKLDF
ncbi:elongator complex protein 4 [Thrips palmi]|uniref:Elongator complex protein 4 n=1 Tax=Thrips palmi TaxID=161013 RepID=A0A6P8Z087_THRPL|nr:elongator complex protein 4 [Thrips palmi]